MSEETVSVIDYEKRNKRLDRLDALLDCTKVAQRMLDTAHQNYSNGAAHSSSLNWKSHNLSSEEIDFLDSFGSRSGLSDAIETVMARHLSTAHVFVSVSEFSIDLPWRFRHSLKYKVHVTIRG